MCTTLAGAAPKGRSELSHLKTSGIMRETMRDYCTGGNRKISDLMAPKAALATMVELVVEEAGFKKLESAKTPVNWIFNPESSSFLAKWDVVAVCGLCFVAMVAPVQVSMLESEFGVLFIISGVVDMIFLVDFVLQFFIMYHIRTDFGHCLEPRPLKIAVHYIRTWFFIDLISVFPFDFITLFSDSKEISKMKALKVIRLMRLLKLARILRVGRVFHRFEVRTSVSYGKLSLLKFFAILLLITHWLANLWALTLVIVDDGIGTPRWIDKFDALDGNTDLKTKDTPWKLYVICLYFTSYTITSVGYGDIGPVNIVEFVICIIMIIIAGVSWAIVLGQVSGVVANMGMDESIFRSNMDELNFMMTDRYIPNDMRYRLRSFFLSSKTTQRRSRNQRLIHQLSPGLQGEVVMCLNERWIKSVRVLDKITKHFQHDREDGENCTRFIVQVSLRMEAKYSAQGEFFGEPQNLYIVNRGLVGHAGRIFRTGGVWGEDFCLATLHLIEDPFAHSLTYNEHTTLARIDFLGLVDEFSKKLPALAGVVRYMTVWLAVQRALWQESRNRRKRSSYL